MAVSRVKREATAKVEGSPSVRPEIAVVIGAVQRDRFVRSAVESVLAQTLSRDRYEILVSLDIHSTPVEQYLRANDVRTIRDSDRSQGRVVRAAQTTRAPLIAYLDDDDEFEPERLAEVLRVFREHPEVNFYRNRVSVMDEAGAPTDPRGWDRLYHGSSLDRSGPILVDREAKEIRWAEVLASYPEFNLSSMAVRREVLQGDPGARLERMRTRIDLGHFVEAYLAPGAVYLDDRRLTRYRIHATNESRVRVRPGQRGPNGWEELVRLEAFATERHAESINRWLRQQRITGGLGFHVDRLTRAVHDSAPAPWVTMYSREYLRFVRNNPTALTKVWSWRPLAYSIIQIAAPALTRAPGADHALKRDVLRNYPKGSWTDLSAPNRIE